MNFDGGKLGNIDEITIPCYRRLLRLKGDLDAVKAKLLLAEANAEGLLPAWIEVQVETESYIHDLNDQLKDLIEDKPFIERLFIKQIRIRPALQIDQQVAESFSLTDLDPVTVFKKRCESELAGEDHTDLIQTFQSALELMRQKN